MDDGEPLRNVFKVHLQSRKKLTLFISYIYLLSFQYLLLLARLCDCDNNYKWPKTDEFSELLYCNQETDSAKECNPTALTIIYKPFYNTINACVFHKLQTKKRYNVILYLITLFQHTYIYIYKQIKKQYSYL